MPLLHQDNSRGGDGPSDRPRPCRSIAEILGLDSMLSETVGTPTVVKNNYEDWSWETPGSPEVAQTPRAMVPAACFPPRHPRAFASYSESAQPGASWNDDNGNKHGIQDLISSLKALTLPANGPGSALGSPPPPAILFDTSVEPPWSPEQCSFQLRDENNRALLLSRRSSFCGEVQAARNGAPPRWTGQLPLRAADPDGGFSSKLFVGGLPWDTTENSLMHAMRHFQPQRIEWPGREQGESMRGFAYVTLDNERRVRALLAACRRGAAGWYYRLHTRRCRTKEAQVIPWAVNDANWVCVQAARLAPGRTVFVGALHGMLSASALAMIMNDVFSGVVYAGIDTDKNKYPIGSGRVTFDNVHSYVRAISAAYIEIRTDKFTKKVQVDPYLEDSMCAVCNVHQGPYFCREPTCFGYFCRSCWSRQHATEKHKPLMRNCKTSPAPAALLAPPAGTDHDHYNGLYGLNSDNDGTPSPPTTSGSGGGSGGGGGGGGGSGSGDETEAGASEERAGFWPPHQKC